ncbi:hypothetical protein VSU16_03185 [Cetobacterium somerae]|uniref:hypothetical protein n=1 Tax=Cetobacterium somerae TaxID=188913 RepID=UPI002E7AC4EF|nr:hypothetical protein [Cetobacterium somerae]WVJ01746.1 hypothetical protein VSU16_03185 [Cetobacterium somerae]
MEEKRILKSTCFRIKKGYDFFEYDIDGIGKFEGNLNDLIKDIEESSTMSKMLSTTSWIENGAYGISHPNLLKRNADHEIFTILKKYEKRDKDLIKELLVSLSVVGKSAKELKEQEDSDANKYFRIYSLGLRKLIENNELNLKGYCIRFVENQTPQYVALYEYKEWLIYNPVEKIEKRNIVKDNFLGVEEELPQIPNDLNLTLEVSEERLKSYIGKEDWKRFMKKAATKSKREKLRKLIAKLPEENIKTAEKKLTDLL